MSDRSAWWRTGAGAAAWLALALSASGAAWAAVAVVGDESQPAAVSVPTTRDAGPSSTPTPSDPGSTVDPGSTGAPPGGGASGRETLTSPGGTVTVACTGASTIRLVAALPDVTSGWAFAEDVQRGPDEVDVEFTDGDEELRTRARCEGGAVQPDVETD